MTTHVNSGTSNQLPKQRKRRITAHNACSLSVRCRRSVARPGPRFLDDRSQQLGQQLDLTVAPGIVPFLPRVGEPTDKHKARLQLLEERLVLARDRSDESKGIRGRLIHYCCNGSGP